MNSENLIKELSFKAIRSSGAGGQHVNKTSSQIVLTFDVLNSKVLNDEEKESLFRKLKTRLSKEFILTLNCSETRSQHKNKEIVIKRFLELISDGLKVKKYRKKSKPSKASIKKRLEKKAKHALKKSNRKKPDFD
ncbi:MAG: aminoacyl-tRNA hydrolase [Flavobacteriaceae bacterium]|nr:aminoacyl-tRNA hydrolase [Flavobacteriaceae bacterium]